MPSLVVALNRTNSSGWLTGSDLRRTALTRVKIAVFAPIPSASVITAMAAKPLRFSKLLKPLEAQETGFNEVCEVVDALIARRSAKDAG